MVVYGHTPGATPVIQPKRIGIDTEAVIGGPLTRAVPGAEMLAFLKSRRPPRGRSVLTK